ncbi:uncharacterized protein LOC128952353 [Oppia nitens]|uniref:uncharacterized protein LOC128952353 n=1 Tax=Oppia nitens TaxID=1686743 RepID=UPI0023DCCFEE|nr:uncharacterized protein LOC128952353 [Oppia nitens]
MTALNPHRYYRNEIVDNNYGTGISRNNHADWVVYVKTDRLSKNKLHCVTTGANQDIYRYDGDIQVSAGDIHDKPRCLKTGSVKNKPKSSTITISYTAIKPVANMTVPDKLYHYVCTADAQTIRNNKQILPSSISGQSSGVIIGNGILLSSMNPNRYYRKEILQDIYDDQCPANCADNVVVVVSVNQLIDINKLFMFERCPWKSDLFYYNGGVLPVQPNNVMDKPRCAKPTKK